MQIKISDLQGNVLSERAVGFEVITNAKGTQAVHDALVAHRAARRAGTACTKSVGEVAGTNKKPWRQKGTGRARAGSFRSPLWRGGGVVFGPKPRDFSVKLNARVRQLALRKAISARLSAGEVMVVDELKLGSHKTKDFLQTIAPLNVLDGTLLIVAQPDRQLRLASRNVPGVRLTTGDEVSLYQVLWPQRILFTQDAFQKLEQRLNRGARS